MFLCSFPVHQAAYLCVLLLPGHRLWHHLLQPLDKPVEHPADKKPLLELAAKAFLRHQLSLWLPEPGRRCPRGYLAPSKAPGWGLRAAPGSGRPWAATAFTAAGALGALGFDFAWVLVPSVPAQVYWREGGLTIEVS